MTTEEFNEYVLENYPDSVKDLKGIRTYDIDESLIWVLSKIRSTDYDIDNDPQLKIFRATVLRVILCHSIDANVSTVVLERRSMRMLSGLGFLNV
jgi:hypothetical protein